MVKVKYQGHNRRKQKARELWYKIFELVNKDGVMPGDIPSRLSVNPQTGKPYSVKHIYGVLKKFQKGEV